MTGNVITDAVSPPSGTLTVAGVVAANSLTLVTDLPLTEGGTGASTAAAARTSLDVDQAGTAIAMAIALG